MRSCGLVIMDAGPLIKLALARELDLLLAFGVKVYVPDEVYFEAVEKFAWAHGIELPLDKAYLRDWISHQKSKGLLEVPATLVGETASAKRKSGEYLPKNHRKNTGELAAQDFFNNREDFGHIAGEPALLLIYERPGIKKIEIQGLDVHLLTTYAALVALEELRIIDSADKIWKKIEAAVPTAPRVFVDQSVRGDTEYKSAVRRPR